MKKISSIIFSIALICCFLPVRVFADSATYLTISSGDGCIRIFQNNTSRYRDFQLVSGSARAVIVGTANHNCMLYIISDTQFTYKEDLNSNSTCYVGNPINSLQMSTHPGYYYVSYTYNVNSFTNPLNIPIHINTNYDGFSDPAFNWTYGSWAVDPEPEITFGDLINVGYNTKIAGSGDAAINNLDTITWNPEQDQNGNDISGMSVTIRAVPGKYSAQSSQSILEQLYSNFVLDTLHISELDTVNASDGSFSVTWNDVIHEFDLLGIPGFWFATKDTVKDPEGGYIKRGWIYQIRLEGEDYIGDWQTVYTATSSGVENDLTIVNSSTINQTLINSITEINNLNNTENNWYINNTTINMGEYSDPGSSGKPWWAYLLEAIVSLLNGVIDAIANLVGSLIDGLLGLFSFDSFSIPDFTTNKQTIKQNSGIFGESIDLLQGINSTLSNADGTADPILYYPGLELMGEEFIPEITINLNTYVSDLGLTEWHNLAYVCTDAMIWISLIYTIYRKLIGVFKK